MHSSDPIIQAVLKADHLSEETRRVYSKNLSMIAQAARQQPLVKVLTQHPHKVVQYIPRKYTEVASRKTLLVSIMAVYRLLDLKVKARPAMNYTWTTLTSWMQYLKREAKQTCQPDDKQPALSFMKSCSM